MQKLSLLLSVAMLSTMFSGACGAARAADDSIVNLTFEDETVGGAPAGWSNGNNSSVKEGHGGKYMAFNLSGGSGQNTSYSFESQSDTFTVSFDLRHDADSTLGFQVKLSDYSTEKEIIGPNVVIDLTRQSYFQYNNGTKPESLPNNFRAYAGSWYRMTMIVNPADKNYDLYVGGYKVGDSLKFRQDPSSIDRFIIAQNGSGTHNISIDNLKIDKGEIPPTADTYYEDIDFNQGVNDSSAIIKSPAKGADLTYSGIKEATDLHGKYYAVSEIPTTQVKHTHMLPVSFTDKVTAEFDFMVDPSTDSPIQIRLTGGTGTGTNLITYNGKKNEIAFYNGDTNEPKYAAFYPGQWYTVTLCVTNPEADDCKYDAYINGVKCVEDFSCRTKATVDRIEFLSHANDVTNAFNIDNIKLYGDIVIPEIPDTIADTGFEYCETETEAPGGLFGWNGNADNIYKIMSSAEKGKYLCINADKDRATTYTLPSDPGTEKFTLSYDFMYPSGDGAGYQLRLGDGTDIGVNLQFKQDGITANANGENINLFSGGLETDKWHEIDIIVDPANAKYNAYLDGQSLKTDISFRESPQNLMKFILYPIVDENVLAVDNLKLVHGEYIPDPPKLRTLYDESFDDMEPGSAVTGWSKGVMNVEPREDGDGNCAALKLENIPSPVITDYYLPQVLKEDDFTFSMDVMMGESNSNSLQLNLISNEPSGTGDMQLASIMIDEGAMTQYYTSNSESSYTNNCLMPGIGRNRWHNIKFDFHLADKNFDMYMDDVLKAENIQFRYSAAESFKYIRINAGTTGKDYEMYFDNIKVCRGRDGVYFKPIELLNGSGAILSKLTPGETVTGRFYAMNAGAAAVSADIMSAAYAEGYLTSSDAQRVVIPADDGAWNEYTVSAAVNEADDAVKVFVWDDNMKPLMDVGAYINNPAEKDEAVLYIVGDSTVEYLNSSMYPDRKGWGAVIGDYLNDSLTVKNNAIGGRSSKSFITEGRLSVIENQLKEGDYLMVQMGHNDRKTDEYYYTNPETSYKENLAKYAAVAKAKGAHLIFVTPPVCLRITGDYEGFDYEGNGSGIGLYADAMKEFAQENNLPVIDLYSISMNKFNELGVEYCRENIFMYNQIATGSDDICKDGVHFREFGARMLAQFITESIKEQGIVMSEFVK